MDTTFGTDRYWTSEIRDNKAGYAGIRLHRVSSGKESLAADVLYWDADGHFYVQTIDGGVPVEIIEAAITEAKQKVTVR